MTSLSKQDLHCISRIIQSALFTDGDILYGCQYCKYSLVCGELFKVSRSTHLMDLRTRLQDLTGVDLSLADREDKFLAASFQKLYPERYNSITNEYAVQRLDKSSHSCNPEDVDN